MANTQLETLTITLNAEVGNAKKNLNNVATSIENLEKIGKNADWKVFATIKRNLEGIANIDFTNVANSLHDVVDAMRKLGISNKSLKDMPMTVDVPKTSPAFSGDAKEGDFNLPNFELVNLQLPMVIDQFKELKDTVNELTPLTPLAQAQQTLEQAGFSAQRTSEVLKDMGLVSETIAEQKTRTMKEALESLGYTGDNLARIMEEVGISASEAGREVGRSGKEAHKSTPKWKKLLGQIKRITFYRMVRRAIQIVTQAIKEGIENIAKFDANFNKSMSEIKSSFTFLKNSIGTAFAPVIEALTPIITKLLDGVAQAFNKLGEIFSALLGKTTFTSAIKNAEDYAKSLEKVKNTALGIDELNVLNAEEQQQMFEEQEVQFEPSDNLKHFFESIENFFNNTFGNLKTSFAPVIESFKVLLDTFLGALAKIIDSITPIVTWLEDILGKLINTLLQILNPFIEKLGDFVSSILDTVGGILESLTPLVDVIIRLIDILGGAVFDILGSLLDAITPIVEAIGGLVEAILNGLGLGGDALDGFAETIGGIVNTIKPILEKVSKIITDVVNTLEPLAEIVGNILGWLLEGFIDNLSVALEATNWLFDTILNPLLNVIKDTLTPVLDAIKLVFEALQPVFEGIKDFFDKINDSIFGKLRDVLDGIFEKLGGKIEVVNGIKTYATMTNPIGAITTEAKRGNEMDWKRILLYLFTPLGIGGIIYDIKNKNFATGGFPEDGFFFANHNELVGQFSNGKTAVANNEQITEGIYRAVLQAMNDSTRGGNGGEVVLKLDGREVARTVNKYNANRGAGVDMFKGGTKYGY